MGMDLFGAIGGCACEQVYVSISIRLKLTRLRVRITSIQLAQAPRMAEKRRKVEGASLELLKGTLDSRGIEDIRQ